MPVTTFTPCQNVYISSAYPDQNFANRTQGDVLFAGTFTDANDIYRSLLQFDIFNPTHQIPPNSTIESAFLLHQFATNIIAAVWANMYNAADNRRP